MPHIRRILHPTDFSERSEAAWKYAELLANRFGSELVLLHVLQEPIAVLPESSLAVAPPAINLPELMDAAEQGLGKFEAAAPATIVDRTVRNGPAAEEIVHYAKEAGADLIVLGTHGRTGLAHVLLGSVAEKVVRKAPCAVLTVRPRGHGCE
ncbi:MAG: universal stress protein [Planctomycetaceae bacterium]